MTVISTHQKRVSQYRIDLPKSYQCLEAAIERYNAQFAKPKLKLPHIFLGRELIRLYAMEFQRWQAARGFAVQLDWEEMPLLATNNEFLADITGRTGRSIRNYRKALEQAGFLAPVGQDEEGNPLYSVFYGRTSDFELAISPGFLWIEGRHSTARLSPRNAPTPCMRKENRLTIHTRKNFPPTSTCTVTSTQQEQQELVGGKICSDAEKNGFAKTCLPESSASCQPEQPEQPEPVNRNGQSRQQARTRKGRPAAVEAQLNWEAWTRKGATVLWRYAQTWLYPGEFFPQGRRQAILARLAAMYGDPPHPRIELYDKITRQYVYRLKLTHLHWHREYGALPEPELFFDTGNTQNGFILTKKWPDDPEKYPRPARQTYRMPGPESRGAKRRKQAIAIGDIIYQTPALPTPPEGWGLANRGPRPQNK